MPKLPDVFNSGLESMHGEDGKSMGSTADPRGTHGKVGELLWYLRRPAGSGQKVALKPELIDALGIPVRRWWDHGASHRQFCSIPSGLQKRAIAMPRTGGLKHQQNLG